MSTEPRVRTVTATAEDQRIAYLASLAVLLGLAEGAIPSPIPGIKPGLANLVTLLVFCRYGWATAAWIAALRVVAVGLIFGTLLSPAFFLSLAGMTGSLLALGALSRVPQRWLGPVGLSIAAAFAHMAGQLLLAVAWLLPWTAAKPLLPLFAGAAWVFGLTNGLIVARWLRRPGSETAAALPAASGAPQ